MSPPANDPDDSPHGTDEHADRPAEFDPPTEAGESDEPTAAEDIDAASPSEESPAATTSESLRRTLDGLLPEASVESDWWYWIAAVPLYFLVTLVGGVLAAGVFVFAGILDIAGLGGLASVSTFILFGGVATLFGLFGVVIAIVFPVATYIDARAIESAGGEWTPDPVVWGLLAVVAVLVTNFILSVPLALYYLYRRHEAVGTP